MLISSKILLKFILIILFFNLSTSLLHNNSHLKCNNTKAKNKKILFYVPTLSFSHVAFNQKIAKSLADNGLDVTIILPDIDPLVKVNFSNSTSRRRINIGLDNGIFPDTLWKNPGPYEDSSLLNPKILYKLIKVSSILTYGCYNLINNKNLIQSLINENFEIGFVEQYDSCGLGLFKTLGIKNIHWLSATNIYRLQPETVGVNYPLSYVSELFSPFGDIMNFSERILNLLTAIVTEGIHTYFSKMKVTDIFKIEFPKSMGKIDNVWNIASTSQSIIANNLPLLDFSSPTSNMIYNVAGITVDKTNNELDERFKKITQQKSYFFLVTFGSIAKTSDMPFIMRYSLFNAFEKFPNITFIVKFENQKKEIVKHSENVFLVKWLPQIALMKQKNYKGIITHGGWSSMIETLTYGKPMILMPLFADHGKNSKIIEQKKLGILIDKMNINLNTFSDSLTELIDNPTYDFNCKRYALMLQKTIPIEKEKLIYHVVKNSLKNNRNIYLKIKSPNIIKIYFVDLVFILFLLIYICKN
uniref:glucuronosyltransferase n=1 Tax=Strongyloides papillosus TaxID=174720 RepID=A0A0N5B8G0_STREA